MKPENDRCYVDPFPQEKFQLFVKRKEQISRTDPDWRTGTDSSLSGCNFAVRRLGPRFGNLFSRAAQSFNVEFDGIVHLTLDFFAGVASGGTTG